MAQATLFELLTAGLEATIRDMNPWWRGERLFGLPPVRRWAFGPLRENLKAGMTAATVLRGPRQVGKTTLLNQVIHALLDEGVAPHRIFKIQFDELPELKKLPEPILELSRWYAQNVLGRSLNQAATDGEMAFIFLDEVQNLPDWAPQLKHLADIHPVRVLVTGSSALRIEAGRDSLAGRITTLEMGPLLLRELAEIRGFGALVPHLPANGLAPLRNKQFWLDLRAHGEVQRGLRRIAFEAFCERGAYPAAHAHAEQPWERVADLLNETVIRRAIQHDLRLGPRGKKRDEHLLADSAAGYFLASVPNLDVAHFPERPTEPEVDYVATIGEQRIPVEVKYRRRIDYRDTLGLRAFIEKAHYNAPFAVLVTLHDEPGSDDPRIVSLPLSTLLLMR